ncbi:MAG: iron-molybdenum cofactor biosynthesis protein [Ignavibacteriales bacterium]|nr:iron-molybdenum cofactor biosynthesis protein [Ignavibacteriales bacterium]
MLSETNSGTIMKIAVATDDFLTVTGHIGRCNGFIIYELDNTVIANRVQIENTFTHHKMSEHHHGDHEHNHSHGHENLIEGLKGCSALICTAAGWRVVEDLKRNNINVIFTDEEDADTAVIKFAEGTLEISEEGICRAH